MASRFGDFGLRSLAGFDESGKGLNNRRIHGLESVENLDGGIRVLDEAKVLVDVTNRAVESLNDGFDKKEFEDMDGSTSQVANMMVWDNDFMLDMIALDLDWRYGCAEEEVRGGNGSQSGRGRTNRVGNLNPGGRETIGKAENKHGIRINGSMIQGLNSANLACARGVKVLRGGQGSIPDQMVPGLKSLAKTFSPDGVVDFVKFASTHPSRAGTLFVAEIQAGLTAYNRWRGHYHLPSFEEGFWYLVDDEKGERSEYDEVNKSHSNHWKARASPSFDENRDKKKRKRNSSVIPSLCN